MVLHRYPRDVQKYTTVYLPHAISWGRISPYDPEADGLMLPPCSGTPPRSCDFPKMASVPLALGG